MNFIITECFYPIDPNENKKFWGGLFFDNPRSKVEVDYIADILKKINYEDNRPFPEEEKQVGKEFLTLRLLFENYCENNKNIKEFNDFYKKHRNEKNIYRIFAKMWVIIRFEKEDNISSNQSTLKIDKNVNLSIEDIELDFEWEYSNNYIRICSYMSFLDFMCSPKNRIPSSIVMEKNINEKRIMRFLPNLLMTTSYNRTGREKGDYPYYTFDEYMKEYNSIIKLVGDKFNDREFIYICEIIKNSADMYFRDRRMYNISLCSILEFLVAHKPDNNRFNIDESISKQFVSKILYLLYENNSNINVFDLKQELKYAYSIRSDIAHGNFENIDKTIQKLYELYGFNNNESSYSLSYTLENLNLNLTYYVKVLLFLYLNDSKKLELMKNI